MTAVLLREAIDEARRRRGISVSALAKRTGITRQTLINTLHGHQKPTADTVTWICGALGLDAGELLQNHGAEIYSRKPQAG